MDTAYNRRKIPHLHLSDLFFRIDQDNLRIRIEQLHTRLVMYPVLILS